MGYISTTNSRQSVNLFVEPDHLQFSGKGCHLPLLCIRRFVVKDGARLRIPPTRGVDNVARWRGGFLCSEASRVDAVDQVDHPRVGARGGRREARGERCAPSHPQSIHATRWHAFMPTHRFVHWLFVHEAHRHSVRLDSV